MGLPPHLYFWRDRTGHEVDLIGEWGGQIRAIEIKYGATFQPTYIKNLQYFKKLHTSTESTNLSCYLIYTGAQKGTYLEVAFIPMNLTQEILK